MSLGWWFIGRRGRCVLRFEAVTSSLLETAVATSGTGLWRYNRSVFFVVGGGFGSVM